MIRVVFSMETDLTPFSEADILYYKLHGSIDLANTDAGRLILTKEDYRYYEVHRKPLFRRLERDLLRRTFVFVGYSLHDPNFRAILEDCRNELSTRTLPLSFAVRSHFTEVEETFWPLLETLFPELWEPNLPPSLYLVTGAAGTGKTTLIHSVAYDLANDLSLPVLVHIPGTPLDSRFLGPLINDKNPQRIIIIVHHAAEYIKDLERFMDEAKQKSLPLTVILEERRNQWTVASSTTRSRLTPPVFELGPLSQTDIDTLLESLPKYGALGKLTGSSRSYQVEHFTALAHRELLVALRELTSEASFDDIIRDEYNKIPSETAHHAYAYVAALA